MTRNSQRALWLLQASSMTALLLGASSAFAADAAATQLDEVVVTAQRREESLQDVPLAVTALTADALKAQRIEGGASLQNAVPNVSFTRGNSGGYNFAVRGISNGVGVHVNNAPQEVNRLADSDFYDVERVEVLRGPQGTLYGRNATSGVINIITAKPKPDFSAQLTGEYGNYNTRRLQGYVNMPLNEVLMVRVAATMLERDGYSTNEVNNEDVDARHLNAFRVTVRFAPNDRFKADLMMERFAENDSRPRFQKQLCITDPGPAQVGNATTGLVGTNAYSRNYFSRGCAPGLITDPATLGAFNSSAMLGGILGDIIGLTGGNAFAGRVQSPNLRSFVSYLGPAYRAHNDVYQLPISYAVSDHLTLTSLSSYTRDSYSTFQDYDNVAATVPFRPLSVTSPFNGVTTVIAPNGFVSDPQLGTSNMFLAFGSYTGRSTQKSQEFRLSSDFGGPINFDVGAMYNRYSNFIEYGTGSNTYTAYSQYQNALNAGNPAFNPIFIDTVSAVPANGSGHNYYYNSTLDKLTSKAVSGEVYWRPNDQFKVTLGGRYTVDDIKKIQYTIPLLVQGSAAPAPAATAGLTNKKFTYRLSADWTPKLTFTDQTLFYASLSSGYRNGGVNATGPKRIFAPETVTAYELGTRNTLLDNRLTLNATAFYYKYGDYQISKALNRQAFTENIDAEIKGAEFEAVFRPIEGVRLNAQIGYLDTKATNGTSINVYDRTAGNPNLTYVRTTGAAGCVVPTSLAVTAQTAVNATVAGLGPSPTYQQLVAAGGPVRALCTNALATGGVDQALKGRQLPQAPHWTVALGAQYQWDITGAWNATARVDYYRRSDSYSRIYNTISDKVPAYDNTNISLVMANPTLDLDVQLFVKNVGNNTSITNIYLSDEAAAFTRNVFLLDPRTYGISVTKRF